MFSNSLYQVSHSESNHAFIYFLILAHYYFNVYWLRDVRHLQGTIKKRNWTWGQVSRATSPKITSTEELTLLLSGNKLACPCFLQPSLATQWSVRHDLVLCRLNKVFLSLQQKEVALFHRWGCEILYLLEPWRDPNIINIIIFFVLLGYCVLATKCKNYYSLWGNLVFKWRMRKALLVL